MDHKQYNLPSSQQFQPGQDWVSSGNVVRTDKTLNVKDKFVVNDFEVLFGSGQKFKRTNFSTVLSGSTYSANTRDFLIGITSLSYAPNIGLPSPKLVGEGKTLIVKDEAGGAATTTITIRSAGEETIDGTSTTTLTANYQSKRLYSDGSNWFTC